MCRPLILIYIIRRMFITLLSQYDISHNTEVGMRNKIRYFSAFCALVSIAILTTIFSISRAMPDTFSVIEGKQLVFSENIPVTAVSIKSKGAITTSSLKAGSQYYTDIKLFGVIPVKHVMVDVVKETDVIPSGQAFGVKLYTEGVVIVGLSDVDTSGGPKNPAYDAGVRIGDIIMAIDGKPVATNDDVAKAFEKSSGKILKISLKRNNVGFTVMVLPQKSVSENCYKAGMWVRDSTAGIGTLTFVSPGSDICAGLGHGICDVDTGEIMPLLAGDIVRVHINGITKGAKGEPGELKGYFAKDEAWGQLYSNTETGVYGVLNSVTEGKAVPVAMSQQVHVGPATILTTIDGSAPKQYAVRIEKVHFNDAAETKNMVIKVTDPVLLAKTGGIVQGMSGSPIMQDGKLVGAVTHVFVNDPTSGYGIFAENMLKTVKTIEKSYQKDVS